MRHVVLAVGVAALALGIASAGSAQTRDGSAGGILGVVPAHIGNSPVTPSSPRPVFAQATASPFDSLGPTSADNLTNDGPDHTIHGGNGPVMTTNTNYIIYWAPTGYSFPANYQSTINGYFTNIAADSGSVTNVDAAGTQYDSGGTHVQYDSTFAGSAVDTQKFPASGCADSAAVIGTNVCLTDAQAQTEIKRFADAQGWPHGPNVEFFLYTAPNVGSCQYSGKFSSDNPCAYDYYCAYHWFFGDTPETEYIYANMAYPNQKYVFGGHTYPSVCDTGQHPNGTGSEPAEASPTPLDAADEVISITSHEHNESVTDPTGDSWYNDDKTSLFYGYENGDMCAWYLPDSAVLGWTPKGQFNQIIGNGVYYTQGEWSNASATSDGYSGCVWYHGDVSSVIGTGAPVVSGAPAIGSTLSTTDGDWGNATAISYQWERCDTVGDNCVLIPGALSSTYKLVNQDGGHEIRSLVTAGNAAGTNNQESDATDLVPATFPYVVTTPSITGTPQVGHPLTGLSGAWSNTPTKYTIVWQRCDGFGANCKPIKTVTNTDGSSVSYTLTAADDTMTIRLVVTAANKAGTGFAASSDATAPVFGEPTPLVDPSIDGSPLVGVTLTGHVGSWTTPEFPITAYKVNFTRCAAKCTIVKSATLTSPSATLTYKLVAADDKASISFNVTAVNKAGSTLDNALIGPIGGEPTGGAAAITGSTAKNHVLTATASGFSSDPTYGTPKYKYEWERCDSSGDNCKVFKAVTVATLTTTYTSVATDVGHQLRVRITASNTAGSSSPVESDGFGPITA
jgi:hypothetical protein